MTAPYQAGPKQKPSRQQANANIARILKQCAVMLAVIAVAMGVWMWSNGFRLELLGPASLVAMAVAFWIVGDRQAKRPPAQDDDLR